MVKNIVDLSKESDAFKVKGAIIEGQQFDVTQVVQLAELPPLPILRAQLLSMLNSPSTQLAGIFAGSVRQLLNVLKAYSDAEADATAAA